MAVRQYGTQWMHSGSGQFSDSTLEDSAIGAKQPGPAFFDTTTVGLKESNVNAGFGVYGTGQLEMLIDRNDTNAIVIEAKGGLDSAINLKATGKVAVDTPLADFTGGVKVGGNLEILGSTTIHNVNLAETTETALILNANPLNGKSAFAVRRLPTEVVKASADHTVVLTGAGLADLAARLLTTTSAAAFSLTGYLVQERYLDASDVELLAAFSVVTSDTVVGPAHEILLTGTTVRPALTATIELKFFADRHVGLLWHDDLAGNTDGFHTKYLVDAASLTGTSYAPLSTGNLTANGPATFADTATFTGALTATGGITATTVTATDLFSGNRLASTVVDQTVIAALDPSSGIIILRNGTAGTPKTFSLPDPTGPTGPTGAAVVHFLKLIAGQTTDSITVEVDNFRGGNGSRVKAGFTFAKAGQTLSLIWLPDSSNASESAWVSSSNLGSYTVIV